METFLAQSIEDLIDFTDQEYVYAREYVELPDPTEPGKGKTLGLHDGIDHVYKAIRYVDRDGVRRAA
jgi:hypothetical protein